MVLGTLYPTVTHVDNYFLLSMKRKDSQNGPLYMVNSRRGSFENECVVVVLIFLINKKGIVTRHARREEPTLGSNQPTSQGHSCYYIQGNKKRKK